MEPANPETPANTDTPPSTPVAQPEPASKPAVSDLPPMPENWPGAFGLYKYSKQAVKFNLQPLVLIYILEIIASILLRGILSKRGGGLLSFAFGGLTSSAAILIYLASLRREHTNIKKALSDALPFWLKVLGLQAIIGLTLLVSFLLLVVPFFFVLPRVVLATYFLIDKKMGIMDAYKASWAATKGHAGKVWGVTGAFFVMVLLMVTIIGIPFAFYFLLMYSAAPALLYMFIVGHSKVETPATTPASPPAPVSPPAPTN